LDKKLSSVGIIGAGKFGTALAQTLAKNDIPATLWLRDPQKAREINNRSTSSYYPNKNLHSKITASTNIEEIINSNKTIIYSCSSFVFRKVLSPYKKLIQANNNFLINTAKGLDSQTNKLFFETSIDLFGEKFTNDNYFLLTGPSFANELFLEQPTCITLCGKNEKNCEVLQKLLGNKKFRIYINDDFIACQLGGLVKNIIAIAVGVCDGQGYGSNTKTSIINWGHNEITKIGIEMGAKAESFLGLATLGDLILTCTSEQSRNYKFGKLIGKGASIPEALTKINSTVEGYYSAKAFFELTKTYKTFLPITNSVYSLLYKDKSPATLSQELLNLPLKKEC